MSESKIANFLDGKIKLHFGLSALAILVFVFCPGFSALAQELVPSNIDTDISGPVEIDADEVVYYRAEDRYIARGNVTVTTSKYRLECDEIEVNNVTGEVDARGHVVIVTDESRLECESIHLNRTTEKGVVVHGTLYIAETGARIEADKIEKVGEGTYVIEGARYTTCRCGPDGVPDWSVEADGIDLTEGGYARARKAGFMVKNSKIMRLPYVIFPVKEERQSGFLMPDIGYSARDGIEFGLPFYVAAARWWDLTATERFLEKRGFKHELETRWVHHKGRKGTFEGYYISDWKTGAHRWAWIYEGRFPLFLGIDWRQDTRFMSDNEYVRDFRSDDLTDDPRARFLESRTIFDRRFAWGEADLYMSYMDDLQGDDVGDRLEYPDNDGLQPNRLPSFGLRTTLIPIPHTGGFLLGVRTSFDNFYFTSEDEGSPGSGGNDAQRGDIYSFVTRPIIPRPGFYIVPEAGLRGSGWDVNGENHERLLAVGKAEAGTRLYRRYGENYKHVVEPRIRYVVTDGIDADLPPRLDFTDKREDFEAIDFNLDQHLMTRSYDHEGILRGRDMVQIELTQRYRPDEQEFTMFRGQLLVRVSDYVSIESDARYEMENAEWRYIMAGVIYETERGDRVSTTYRYQGEDDWEFLRTRAKYQLAPAIALTYMHYYNITEQQFIDHGGGVMLTPPSKCWTMLSEVIYHTDPDDIRINFWINLYGLGSTGPQ